MGEGDEALGATTLAIEGDDGVADFEAFDADGVLGFVTGDGERVGIEGGGVDVMDCHGWGGWGLGVGGGWDGRRGGVKGG